MRADKKWRWIALFAVLPLVLFGAVHARRHLISRSQPTTASPSVPRLPTSVPPGVSQSRDPAAGELASLKVLAEVEVEVGREGRNLGTLFEARFPSGLICAAGAPNEAQTRQHSVGGRVEFFFSAPGSLLPISSEPLGRPSELGTRPEIAVSNGRLVDLSESTYLGDDGSWHPYRPSHGRAWSLESVGGHALVFCTRGVIRYQSKVIVDFGLDSFCAGTYYQGTLYVVGVREGATVLVSSKWKPGSEATAGKSVPLPHLSDGYGILGWRGAIYVAGDRSTILRVRDEVAEVLTTSDYGEFYGILEVDDYLLFGHFPTGHLYRFDGEQLLPTRRPPLREGQWEGPQRFRLNEIEAIEEASPYREAQTLYLYGGAIHVGTYPWGHLWRRRAIDEGGAWTSTRLFEHPNFNSDPFPYRREVEETLAAHENDPEKRHPKWLVRYMWGQRIHSAQPYENGLAIGLGNTTGFPSDPQRDSRMSPSHLAEYGSVVKVWTPNTVTVELPSSPEKLRLQFATSEDKLLVVCEGRVLGEAELTLQVPALEEGTWKYGAGIYGATEVRLAPVGVSQKRR